MLFARALLHFLLFFFCFAIVQCLKDHHILVSVQFSFSCRVSKCWLNSFENEQIRNDDDGEEEDRAVREVNIFIY